MHTVLKYLLEYRENECLLEMSLLFMKGRSADCSGPLGDAD